MTELRKSYCRYVVVGLFSLMAAIAYLSRNSIGVFAADEHFRADFFDPDRDSVDIKQALSHVMSAFFWSYALLQIPAGWLGQRFGTRAILSLSMGACGTLTLLMGFSNSILALVFLQMLLGATQAGMLPIAMRSLADWVPKDRRGFATGLIAAFMQVGGAASTALAGYFAGLGFSWRLILVGFSLPALAWTVSFAAWFRNQPEDHAGVSSHELSLIQSGRSATSEPPANEQQETATTNWAELLKSKALWAINGQQFFRAAGYIFFPTWFPSYLRETHGVSLSEAGYLSSLPLISILIGSLFGGWLTDFLLRRTGSRAIARQLVGGASLFLCAGLIAAAFHASTATSAIAVISLGTFFSGVTGPSAFAQTIDIAGRNVPVVFGMMNMLGNVGAALCPYVVTLFVEQTGNSAGVLFLFATIYLLGSLCWMFLSAEHQLDGSPLAAIQRS